ncbi:MAG: outer membrane beta-barrel protein [Tannerella sp.]|nr:outer membrane beta-barrel protein [Tannerella sp.]
MKKLGTKMMVMVACLSGISQMYAQHRISGRVMMMEENREIPLEFANVTLNAADSAFVAGITSDPKGYFEFKNVSTGDYMVIVSYLGFAPQTLSLNGLTKSVELGDLLMEEETAQLGTVTVTASNTTYKADRQIVFITEQQKANSSNGINLLNTIQFPRLTVNPVTNTVSLPGDESLRFCINGVKVNHEDVRALQPNEVIRVEYLDNPGLRYGGADVVINYIIRREVAGGSVSVDLGNAVTTDFGDDQVAAKFNYKKSVFGLNYAVRYRNPSKVWANEERTFNFSDGSRMTRFSEGSPGDLSEDTHQTSFNYNLLEEGKYYFNAALRHSFSKEEKMRYSTQYTSLNTTDRTSTYQGSNSFQHLPSVDVYYIRSLKNKQNIILNVVGTYIHSDIDQLYEEKRSGEVINDIVSIVDGDKYSIIGEGIYEKTFENAGRFTTGIKHTQAFADNDYSGTVRTRTKMDQADTYLYVEYAGKRDKFNYTGGAGLSRSQAKQKGEDDYTFYTFRPKLTLQYDFSRSMFVRLKGEIDNTSPSLSNLSPVDQYIDTLQLIRGNPALKPQLNYSANLLFNWKKGIYGINLFNSYIYSPKPVMEEILRENDKFIRTWDNHKNWRKLNSELTLSAGPIRKILMISLTGGVNHYISNGNTYKHTHINWYYRVQAMAMYKKFTAIFQAGSAYDRFSGETLTGGENMHITMLNYNTGKFTAGVGIMLPFSGQYKRYSENRNLYSSAKMDAYANDFSRMLLLKFAWNFNYGRKMKDGSKRLNNTDTDSGVLIVN